MRHFVSFKKNTNLYGKLMVFTDLLRNEIQDLLVEQYDQKWDKIYTEPEAARIVKEIYTKHDNWVLYGEPCYQQSDEHKVSLEPILSWFSIGLPKPTEKDKSTQIGAHIEEFIEFLEAINEKVPDALIAMKSAYYEGKDLNISNVALLDALADQVVTATAVAYTRGFKWDKALTEVNQSNFSKFEEGKPIYNEHGKIMKGKNYRKPNLEEYV